MWNETHYYCSYINIIIYYLLSLSSILLQDVLLDVEVREQEEDEDVVRQEHEGDPLGVLARRLEQHVPEVQDQQQELQLEYI